MEFFEEALVLEFFIFLLDRPSQKIEFFEIICGKGVIDICSQIFKYSII